MAHKWIGLFGVLLLAAGCGGSGDSGDFVLLAGPTEGASELSYPNGHPLLFRTDNLDVLSREAELNELIQNYRVSLGYDVLVVEPEITLLARAHSHHMGTHRFFDHPNPEGDSAWDRATRANMIWSGFGENIATGQETAEEVFADWLASKNHRHTVEDPDWTHIGTGYSWNPSSLGGHLWTTNFKKP